jgi:hypothetical protein
VDHPIDQYFIIQIKCKQLQRNLMQIEQCRTDTTQEIAMIKMEMEFILLSSSMKL